MCNIVHRKASSKKTGEDNESEVLGKTAMELEDSWEAELQSFEPASRLTGNLILYILNTFTLLIAVIFSSSFVDGSNVFLLIFITDADKNNDAKSPERKLDRKLVLLVKQKLGDKQHWILPQGARKDNETMRQVHYVNVNEIRNFEHLLSRYKMNNLFKFLQCAERSLSELCGNTFAVSFMGNAPCGFYKYKYPQKVRSSHGFVGAKVNGIIDAF